MADVSLTFQRVTIGGMSKRKDRIRNQQIANQMKATAEPEKVPNAVPPGNGNDRINNGLEAAVLGGGFPGQGFPGPGGQQVSQLNPLFPNLRWYFASNFRQALSEAYCELGLIQTIVDVPVDDGLRGGVTVTSKQLSPKQLEDLRDAMVRQDDLLKLAQGLKWARLFGGGAVLILTDQDPETPLDTAAINADTKLEFRGVDMWELYFDLQNTNGYDTVIQDEKFDFYSYYGTKVHKSRVLRIVGQQAPSFLRPRLRGWGLSVVECLIRGLNIYLSGTNLIYDLIDEAKIDVYGIKNLTNTLLNPNGGAAVQQRIRIANQQKDFQHAIVMDSEDSYEQKQLTFSGIAEILKENRIEVASVLRMPLTKIFGISAAGFNSGEDDIEVYNGMIESTIRTYARKYVLQMAELRCQKMFGFVPDDLGCSFEPLRILSAEQEEKVKDSKFNRLLGALTAGAITLDEFRDACNKNDLLEVTLKDANGMLGTDAVSDENEPEGETTAVRREAEADSLIQGKAPSAKSAG